MNSQTRICAITRRASLHRILGALFLVLCVTHLAAQPGEIKREAVESSVLASVGYDAKSRLLEIEFHSGATYRYLEVPKEIYRQLLAAESKGHFFGANIRDKFRNERVRPRDAK